MRLSFSLFRTPPGAFLAFFVILFVSASGNMEDAVAMLSEQLASMQDSMASMQTSMTDLKAQNARLERGLAGMHDASSRRSPLPKAQHLQGPTLKSGRSVAQAHLLGPMFQGGGQSRGRTDNREVELLGESQRSSSHSSTCSVFPTNAVFDSRGTFRFRDCRRDGVNITCPVASDLSSDGKIWSTSTDFFLDGCGACPAGKVPTKHSATGGDASTKGGFYTCEDESTLTDFSVACEPAHLNYVRGVHNDQDATRIKEAISCTGVGPQTMIQTMNVSWTEGNNEQWASPKFKTTCMAMKRTMCVSVKINKEMLETNLPGFEDETPRQCASYKHLEFAKIELTELTTKYGAVLTPGLTLVNGASPLSVATTNLNSTIKQNMVDWNNAGANTTTTDNPPGRWKRLWGNDKYVSPSTLHTNISLSECIQFAGVKPLTGMPTRNTLSYRESTRECRVSTPIAGSATSESGWLSYTWVGVWDNQVNNIMRQVWPALVKFDKYYGACSGIAQTL